jgi:hypothetical protein
MDVSVLQGNNQCILRRRKAYGTKRLYRDIRCKPNRQSRGNVRDRPSNIILIESAVNLKQLPRIE